MNAVAALLLPLAVAGLPDRSPTPVSPSSVVWSTGGPVSGSVARILLDSQNRQVLYVLTEGKISLSRDGGLRWTDAMTGFPTFAVVSDVVMSPRSGGTLYAASTSGVYQSSDSAQSWTPLGQATPACVLDLTVDPLEPDTLYARTCSTQLFRSGDGGLVWTPVALPDDLNTITAPLVIAADESGTLYFGLQTGVLRSIDRGQTWVLLGSDDFQDVLAVEIDPSTPTTIYAATPVGVFRSEDRGDSWVRRGSGSTIALAIDPQNTDTLYAGTVGAVWKSFDAGQSWQVTGSGFQPCYSVQALALDPKNAAKIYAATDGQGLLHTADGGATWRSTSIGLPGLPVVALTSDPIVTGAVYAATLPHPELPFAVSVYRSADAGGRWSEACPPGPLPSDINSLVSDPSKPATLYAGAGHCITGIFCLGTLLRSSDGGASWQDLLDAGNITAVGIDPRRPETIYLGVVTAILAGFGRIPVWEAYKSLDGGKTWEVVGKGLPGVDLSSLQVDPSASNNVFAVARQAGVFRSTDGGLSFVTSNSGLTAAETFSLTFDPKVSSTIYLGTGTGLFKSTDSGSSWGPTSLAESVTGLVFDPRDSRTMYAGTSHGVFVSADAGISWSPINQGLARLAVNFLAIDPTGSTLHAATDFGAVYDLTLRPTIPLIFPRD